MSENVKITESVSNDEGSTARIVAAIIDKLYTEFFGVFVPGAVEVGVLALIVFVAFVTVAVSAMLACAFANFPLPYESLGKVVGEIFALRLFIGTSSGGTSSGAAVAACVVFFCLSYLVGEIAYRRNPNDPDIQSILFRELLEYELDNRGREKDSKECVERGAIDLKGMISEICGNIGDLCGQNDSLLEKVKKVRNLVPCNKEFPNKVTETVYRNEFLFPYPCLRRFFRARHLDGMARYVPWCGGFEADPAREGFPRSKETDNQRKRGRRSSQSARALARENQNRCRTEAYCTKHQINALKQAILKCEAAKSDFAESIPKTECHIKILAAFWSVLRICLYAVDVTDGLLRVLVFAYSVFFVWKEPGLMSVLLVGLVAASWLVVCCRALRKKVRLIPHCYYDFFHSSLHPIICLVALVVGFGIVPYKGNATATLCKNGYNGNECCMLLQTNAMRSVVKTGVEQYVVERDKPSKTNAMQSVSKTDGGLDVAGRDSPSVHASDAVARDKDINGKKVTSDTDLSVRRYLVCLMGILSVGCFMVLFWVLRGVLNIWRRYVVCVVHDLRLRELVNVFGAVQIVADELGDDSVDMPTVLRRFSKEGKRYETEFCEHCVYWRKQCSLSWPDNQQDAP